MNCAADGPVPITATVLLVMSEAQVGGQFMAFQDLPMKESTPGTGIFLGTVKGPRAVIR